MPPRDEPWKTYGIPITVHILALASRRAHPYTLSSVKHTFPLQLHPKTPMREVFTLTAIYMDLKLKIFVNSKQFEARDRDGYVFNEDDKIGEELGEGGEVWLVEDAISEEEVRRAELRKIEAREEARLIEKEKARLRRVATKNAKLAEGTPARQLAMQGALVAKSEPRKTPARAVRPRAVKSEGNVRAGRKRVLSSEWARDSSSSSPVAGRSPSPVQSRPLSAMSTPSPSSVQSRPLSAASIRSPSPIRAKPVARLLRGDDKPGGLLESIETPPPVARSAARKRNAMKLPTVRDEFGDPLDFFEGLTPHPVRSTERRGLSSPPANALHAPEESSEIFEDSPRSAQSPLVPAPKNNIHQEKDISAVLKVLIEDSPPISASKQGPNTVTGPADNLASTPPPAVASQQPPPPPVVPPSNASQSSQVPRADTQKQLTTSSKNCEPTLQPADEGDTPAPLVASQRQQALPNMPKVPASRSSEKMIPDFEGPRPRVTDQHTLRDVMATNWNWTAINTAQQKPRHPQSVSPRNEALQSLLESRGEKLKPPVAKLPQCKIDPYDISTVLSDDEDNGPPIKTPAPSRSIYKLGATQRQPSTVSNSVPRNSLLITKQPAQAKTASQSTLEAPVQDQTISLSRNSPFITNKLPQAKIASQKTFEALAQLEGTMALTPTPRVPTNTPVAVRPSAHPPTLSSPTTHVAAALANGRATARRQPAECIVISSDDAVCEDILVDAREKHPTPRPVANSLEAALPWSAPPLRVEDSPLRLKGEDPFWTLRVTGRRKRGRSEEEHGEVVAKKFGGLYNRTALDSVGNGNLEGRVLPEGKISSFSLGSPVRTVVRPDGLAGSAIHTPAKTSLPIPAGKSPLLLVHGSSSSESGVEEIGFVDTFGSAASQPAAPSKVTETVVIDGTSSVQGGEDDEDCDLMSGALQDDGGGDAQGDFVMRNALQDDGYGNAECNFMMSGALLPISEEHSSPKASQESSEPQPSVELRQSVETDPVVPASTSDGTTASEKDQVHEIRTPLADHKESDQSLESSLVVESDQMVESDQIVDSEHPCEAQEAVESERVVQSPLLDFSQALKSDQPLVSGQVARSAHTVESNQVVRADQVIECSQSPETSNQDVELPRAILSNDEDDSPEDEPVYFPVLYEVPNPRTGLHVDKLQTPGPALPLLRVPETDYKSDIADTQPVGPPQAILSDDGDDSSEDDPVYFPVLYELSPPRPALQKDKPQTPRHPLPLLRVPETDPRSNIAEMATPPSAQASKRKREFSDALDPEEEQRMLKTNRREAKRAENKRLREEQKARVQEQRKQQEAWRQEERKRLALEKAHRRALELEIVVSSPLKAAEMGLGWSEGDEDMVESEVGSSPPRRPVVTRLFATVEATVGKQDLPVRRGSDERPSWRELSKKHFSATNLSVNEPAPGNQDDVAVGVVKVEAWGSPFPSGAQPTPVQTVTEMSPKELTVAELPTPQAPREVFDEWALLQATLGADAYSPSEIHNRVHLQLLNASFHGISSCAALGDEAACAKAVLYTACDDADTGMTVKSEASVYHTASESLQSSRAHEGESPAPKAKKKHARKDKKPRSSKRSVVVKSESPEFHSSSDVCSAQHAQEKFEEDSSQTDISRHTIRSLAPSPKNLTTASAQALKETKGNTGRGKKARRQRKDGVRKKKWQQKREKVHPGLYKEVRKNIKHGVRVKEEPL